MQTNLPLVLDHFNDFQTFVVLAHASERAVRTDDLLQAVLELHEIHEHDEPAGEILVQCMLIWAAWESHKLGHSLRDEAMDALRFLHADGDLSALMLQKLDRSRDVTPEQTQSYGEKAEELAMRFRREALAYRRELDELLQEMHDNELANATVDDRNVPDGNRNYDSDVVSPQVHQASEGSE